MAPATPQTHKGSRIWHNGMLSTPPNDPQLHCTRDDGARGVVVASMRLPFLSMDAACAPGGQSERPCCHENVGGQNGSIRLWCFGECKALGPKGPCCSPETFHCTPCFARPPSHSRSPFLDLQVVLVNIIGNLAFLCGGVVLATSLTGTPLAPTGNAPIVHVRGK